MRNDHHRSNTRLSRPVHRGDARYGAWGLAVLATLTASAALSGCVSDPDCGVCDPENLVLESIAGPNYAGKVVKLLGPTCEGDACPGELTSGQYFVDKIIPCADTPEAQKAARGAEEWCKISPLMVTADGLQFIFNNLLDPTTVELVRKSPVNPQLFEVYDWKTRIVHLEGPVARYNGDYRRGASQTQPDRMTRLVNLSCIDNLQDQGKNFTHEELAAGACDGTFAADGKVWPLKTRLDQEIKTYGGETDTRRVSQSCTTPQNGPDTCCDACDYELSVNIAKYGVTKPLGELEVAEPALKRNPNPGAAAPAIACDPMGDKFVECRDFIPHVYRGDEVRRFNYDWNGDGKITEGAETFRVPMADKLRETHPDDRPKGYEQMTVPCEKAEDCSADPGPNLVGMDCVGTNGDGQACTGATEGCENKHCVAQWFVECRADKDTTGEGGFCVDRRWNGQGVSACFTTTAAYKACGAGESCEPFAGTAQAGRRFAYGDADLDGFISSTEGCRASLGGGQDFSACDPYMQSAVRPVSLYDRKETLPSTTRRCVCSDEPADGCQDLVARLCHEGGDPTKPLIADRKGEYALKFVSKNGGVIYDPAIKGVLFLPADLGGIPRSFAEECSEGRARGASPHNIKDGWRANDAGLIETYENFDRAMCSSSEYKVVFATESEGGGVLQYLRDKVGNTLRGKSTYVLRTPDFHVVPGSGFPTDNLRIGACDDFEIRFSNKYDMSPINVNKLQIVEIAAKGSDQELAVVAGGPGCAPNKEEFDMDPSKPPCLTVNVRDQEIGSIRVEIDAKAFGAVLTPGKIYRLKVPGLVLAEGETVFDAMKDPARYAAAFWDACGMPLVTSMPRLGEAGVLDAGGKAAKADYLYDFQIDPPKCKEDQDLDAYQFSCDNAPDVYNPDQRDSDADGFGDQIDLCVSIPQDVNTADSDKDGIGNDCDLCTRQPSNYNANAKDAMAPGYMLVRNIPDQSDFDGDGIGDVCDNCIVASNCSDFGDDKEPYTIGDPIPVTNNNICQVDNDAFPFIGDACIVDGAPITLEGAAGPVGIGPNDDFDQDGLANMADKCPRTRLPACTADTDCGEGIACGANGFCETHLDSDNDGVGDACDNCAYKPNPNQTNDGQMQEDDPDGDFVGNDCETNSECYERADARPVAFYTKVAPSGMCCTTVFKDDTIDAPRLAADGEQLTRDEIDEIVEKWREELAAWQEQQMIKPDGTEAPPAPLFIPLRKDCGDLGPDKCRPLPERVATAPGITVLPPGCAEAGEPVNLDSPEVAGDPNKLYEFMCTLPQLDQDFDGIGDKCDLCKFAFDPDNTLYKDENNKVWPSYGQYCRGPWDPEAAPRLFSACGDAAEEGGGDTETGGTSGGGSSGGTGG